MKIAKKEINLSSKKPKKSNMCAHIFINLSDCILGSVQIVIPFLTSNQLSLLSFNMREDEEE